MKKRIFTFIFFALNILILELGLSLLDPEEIFVKGFDKELLFRMYGEKKGKVVSDEFSVTVETNEYGFRQSKIKNTPKKVLVMGDSFTEGWGVEESEIYLEKLNSSQDEIFFINAGLHGSSPALYAIQLPYLLKRYKPDHVIIQLFDNDLDDNDKLEKFISFYPDGKVQKPKERILANIFTERGYNFLKERSIYRFISKLYKLIRKEPSPILYYKNGREPKNSILNHEQAIQKYGKLRPLGSDINTKYSNQFGFYKDHKNELWKKRLAQNEIYLNQLLEISQNLNIPISFLYIPAKEFFAKAGILGNETTYSYEIFQKSNPFLLQIKKHCDKANLNCIFLTKDFFNLNPENLYFPHDAHLNSKGHEVLSKIILAKLTEKLYSSVNKLNIQIVTLDKSK